MTSLYLPEHVAKRVAADKASSKTEPEKPSAYVKPEDRVLDPSLLEKPLTERLPQPTGWRVLVMPYNNHRDSDAIEKNTINGSMVPTA